MELQKAIDVVNAKFIPTVEKRDSWRVLGKDWKGDCEDYALTVAFLHAGGWLKFIYRFLTGYYKLWLVKTIKTNEGHAVLEVKGKFVDNIYAKLVTEMPAYKFYYVCNPFRLFEKLFWRK